MDAVESSHEENCLWFRGDRGGHFLIVSVAEVNQLVKPVEKIGQKVQQNRINLHLSLQNDVIEDLQSSPCEGIRPSLVFLELGELQQEVQVLRLDSRLMLDYHIQVLDEVKNCSFFSVQFVRCCHKTFLRVRD